MDCGSCSREIVETVERHSENFYIRANRFASLYDSLFALWGWKRETINDVEYELSFIITDKWEGKAYRLVIQRERRVDGERDLWEGEYTYRCILTNDDTSTEREIVELQPQGRRGTDLRRHERRLRVGKAAKVVHGREHRVHAADGTHKQLLQVPYGPA